MSAADVSAAEHMDRMYRYQRHIYDMTRRYYLLGRDRMIAGLEPPHDGSVLEVGCGTGRNLILTARRYGDCRLFGFDISGEMLDTAGANIAYQGLTGRIRLAEADATRFDPARSFNVSAFDRVFLSFTLSMMPPWRDALLRAWDCVAPGGSLHIVDFGQQEAMPRWFRALLFAWLRQFSVFPRAGLRQALEDIAASDGASLRFAPLYRGYAVHAVLARN
jgi:S-adenosylmethionine-diacylgycerolhomoserine-N-methlytransferase